MNTYLAKLSGMANFMLRTILLHYTTYRNVAVKIK